MKQLLYPQEIEVHYIIPAIKRHLALALKEQGLKQKEVAKLLHIEDATVSQYITKKRGAQIEFPENLKEEVKKSATLISDKISLLRETQKLIHLARTSGVVCEAHKKISKVPNDCHTSLNGCFGGALK